MVPILGAEKSKVPFYIAGGALVAWALIVSLGLGLRRPDFPGGTGGERVVIAITVVLVVASAATAVITSGTPAKTAAASAAGAASTQASPTGGEAGATTATSTPAAPPNGTTGTPAPPKATTGTPAPPSSPAAGATTTLKLAANPGGLLSYNTKQLAAKAGKVTITMANMSPLEHNVTVAKGSTVLGATPTFQGGSKTLTLSLKPGTYTFYCSVPGHRQAGMEGTLTVS
jgi:plastocyanin